MQISVRYWDGNFELLTWKKEQGKLKILYMNTKRMKYVDNIY